MKPATCPYCGTPANPLRISLYSTAKGYRCSRCTRRSRFDRRTAASVAGLGAFIGALVQSQLNFAGLTWVTAVVGLTALFMAAMWLFLKLQPLAE